MKKKGVTKKKRNRKVLAQRAAPGAKLSEQQLQAVRCLALQRVLPESPRRPVRSAKTILYSGKLDKTWGKPLGKAKWLAEELRANPSVGVRLLEQEVVLHWKTPGYLAKMFNLLDEYLADSQPVFDKVDYKIANIAAQHPDYTIKQITSDLAKQYPKREWDTLEKCVRRLLQTPDDKMNYAVAHIVKQHPHYSVKEITSALSEKYPNQKWDTLEKRVRQLLNPR
jgi:hypothetical protein